VRENLMMVPDQPAGESLIVGLARRRVRHRKSEVRAKADEVIEFLEITHVADELAGNLSGGQKKLLELGRTMMVDAKIVFARRGGRRRQPHAAQRRSVTRSCGSTRSAATPSA
jgi:branched-chain amino acid transport system ATP-binding protein